MPEPQTREAKIIAALAAIMKYSGFERNFKTDEMERFSTFNGDLGDVTKAVIDALDGL